MPAATGWVQLPSAPVEVLVAASVGVAAVHAVRPLVRGGETLIAAGFGLVHGLAFAGILAALGLAGTASVLALLAFNLGVELAQLSVVAVVLPSVLLLAPTRWYAGVRVTLSCLSLAIATGWIAERVGLGSSPFARLEGLAIARLWVVAGVVGGLALLARLVVSGGEGPRRTTQPLDPASDSELTQLESPRASEF